MEALQALIISSRVKKTSKGSDYADLELLIAGGVDTPIRVSSKKWNISEIDTSSLKEENFILIEEYIIDRFNSVESLIINKYRLLTDGEYDKSKFVLTSYKSEEQLRRDIKEVVNSSIKDKELLRLIHRVFAEHVDKLCSYPAAKRHHHAYFHGLLEHIVEVIKICLEASKIFKEHGIEVDTEILVAGALLHDIGKLYEYEISNLGNITYVNDFVSKYGSHTLLSRDIVLRAANGGDIHPKRLKKLENLILSHHGRLEWGAIIAPDCVEAVILHFADMMSAKVNGLVTAIRNSLEKQSHEIKFNLY